MEHREGKMKLKIMGEENKMITGFIRNLKSKKAIALCPLLHAPCSLPHANNP